MIPKRNRTVRRMIVLASIFGSTGELVRDMWRGQGTKRLMIPLVVFLAVLSFVLVLAATVEAVAPFIYTIF
jgi:Family of unknown function (DUF5989)